MKFTKPFLSFEQQALLLSERGLIIENDTVHYLQHLNYYRLSGYWIPFQKDNKTHRFKPNVRFSDVLNLYLFDRELRLLLLDAIERIEILRNLCAHHSRVWNRKTTKTIKIPRSKPPELISSFNNELLSLRKLYNPLVLVIHLLKIICPDNHFKNRLITLMEKHDISSCAMGFPNAWQRRSVWATEG